MSPERIVGEAALHEVEKQGEGSGVAEMEQADQLGASEEGKGGIGGVVKREVGGQEVVVVGGAGVPIAVVGGQKQGRRGGYPDGATKEGGGGEIEGGAAAGDAVTEKHGVGEEGRLVAFEVNHIEAAALGMDGLGDAGPGRVGAAGEVEASEEEGGLDLPGGEVGVENPQVDVGVGGEKAALAHHAEQSAVGEKRAGVG